MRDVSPLFVRLFPGRSRWLTRLGLLWLLLAMPARAQQAPPPKLDPPPASPTESAPTQPAPTQAAATQQAPTEAPAKPKGLGSLTDLLQEDEPASSVGSFGYRLRRYGISPYIHGAQDFGLLRLRKGFNGAPVYNGFEVTDAHTYIGADILDLVIPEMFLEFEPDQGSPPLTIRYAQLDIRLYHELLVMRSGLFLIPFGVFNSTSFPRFIRRYTERPAFFRELVAPGWREVGVQFFGDYEWSPGLKLHYAAYVTNGLEQPDVNDPNNPDDDGADEGGSLRSFLPTYRERYNSSKSIGARVALDVMAGLTIGLSGYTGPYTKDGGRRLSMVGLDATYTRGPLSVEMESAFDSEQITGGTLKKWGYALLAAYRITPHFEPFIATDATRLGGKREEDRRTYWAGCAFFPFPESVPTVAFKSGYLAGIHGGSGDVDQTLFLQVAVGF